MEDIMKNDFFKISSLILFLFVGLNFYTCDLTLEPSEIELKENPVELKWIKNDYSTEYCWYITENKELFNKGTECDQILLYLSDRYFTYSINDTIYLYEMIDYIYDPWCWCEK